MKFLKYAFMILTLILTGCISSRKMESRVVEENKESMESTYKIGKLYLEKDGCESFIITEGKNQKKLFPVGLDEIFLLNNAILQFQYDLSRAPLPQGCEDCRAVVLRSVTRVKR